MRIAIIAEQATPMSDRAPTGAPAWHATELAGALARAGHDVRVYARADAPGRPRRSDLPGGASLLHVPAGPAKPLTEAALLKHTKLFGQRLAEQWTGDGWRPDIVHAHYWLSGLAAMVASRPPAGGSAIPIVLTYQELGSRRRRFLGEADTSPACRVGFERELGRSVDRIITHCRAETSELIRLGVPRQQITIVPLGVDPDRFAPAGSLAPARHRPPRVVMVGAPGELRERKGYTDAIRALRLVPDAELVVVGGPAKRELRADPQARKLREVAAEAGVGDRVTLVGRVSRDDVPKWYREADVITSASWYDSFGITAVEGMAAGVPVVATEVGGFPDTVVDGLTGRLVPPHQPNALGRAIRSVLADPIQRVEYAAAGLDRVRQVYSWDRVASRVSATYEQLPG
ncbi:MAG TPA: glycosyltransferase [Natronosporangium sp.]